MLSETAPLPATSSSKERSLISNHSILILSGFLAGSACSRLVPDRFEPIMYGAAAVGLVSWVGLTYLAGRARENIAKRAHRKATSKLERRVDRHVLHRAAVSENPAT